MTEDKDQGKAPPEQHTVPPRTFSCGKYKFVGDENIEALFKSPLDPWYVTGFCEGESSFTYNTSSGRITLIFAVKLTKSDAALVYRIYNFFKVGRLYPVKRLNPRGNSGFTKSATYYRVNKINDLEVIVEHFDKFPLQGEKQKKYKIWKEMAILKTQFRNCDEERIALLAKKLSSLSPKNLPWE